jgi:hypothetical protein
MAAAFRQGLSEADFVEGRNIAIEYRWAEGRFGRPALAEDLVRRKVGVIAALGGTPAALAAKAATVAIPIVFANGGDPLATGLVASLNRPTGNMTGVTLYNAVLAGKRLDQMHALVPTAAAIGFLTNRDNPANDIAGDVGVLRGPASWRCPQSAIQLAAPNARRWPAGEFLGASPSSRRDERHKLSLSNGRVDRTKRHL